MIEYGNQQIPINFQQPLQQFYNNTFNTYAGYQIERNMRFTIEQDVRQEYDFIIREAYSLLNKLYENLNNSLTKDSNNIYLTYNGKQFSNSIKDCGEIEAELFNVLLKEVKIVINTNTLVNSRREQPQKVYLPLFLIKSKIEPSLVFDIYTTPISQDNFFKNLIP